MDKSQILKLLKNLGIKSVINWYKPGSEPKKPYAVLHYLYMDPLLADNRVYYVEDRWQLDLITDIDDPATRTNLEQALQDAGLVFSEYSDPDEKDSYVRTIFRFNL